MPELTCTIQPAEPLNDARKRCDFSPKDGRGKIDTGLDDLGRDNDLAYFRVEFAFEPILLPSSIRGTET
jgi:hypothetical protein